MINNLSGNIIPHSLYYSLFIHMLTMNTKTQIKTVAIAVMVAILTSIGSVTDIAAQETNFMPYGSIAQEDQLYTIYEGQIWLNVVLGQGNGQFMKITDIDQDYSIDQAIDRFGIDEDISSFLVEPSQYSNVALVFELDDNLQFQLIGAIEV